MVAGSYSSDTHPRNQGDPSPKEERRDHPRLVCEATMRLAGVGCPDVSSCRLIDYSRGGLAVRVPGGTDLTVGQRFEVVVRNMPNQEAADLSDAMGPSCYATVIRTTTATAAMNPTDVTAGLRFDQPLFL